MTTEAIKAARAEMAAADAEIGAVAKLMAAAKAFKEAGRDKLRAALLDRDAAMPKCVLRTAGWGSGKHSDVEVVIIRKTAKSVFVRTPGDDDDTGKQFRTDKHGNWRPYPADGGIGGSKQLIFEGGAS